MHEWGDENVDWRGINDAADYISAYVRKYGRMTCHGKEKWGCVRLEYVYWGFTPMKFIWPAYLYQPKACPNWLFTLSNYYWYVFPLKYVARLINSIIIPYQKWIMKRAYKKAVKKWPHLEAEIMDEYDWYVD